MVERLAMRPATGAVDGDDVMGLGLPTPDHTDPEAAGPEIPLSLLSVWGGPLKENSNMFLICMLSLSAAGPA